MSLAGKGTELAGNQFIVNISCKRDMCGIMCVRYGATFPSATRAVTCECVHHMQVQQAAAVVT